MASLLLFFLLLVVLFFSTLDNTYANKKHNGFSLKMIHRDSPESPTYRAYLTEDEKIKEYVQSSINRVNSLGILYGTKNTSTTKSSHASNYQFVRPEIHGYGLYYYVQFGLGTFDQNISFKPYNFELDTGSDLTWTQCEGCGKNCFPQADPLYPATQSRSYKPFYCDHCPSTARCVGDGGSCKFNRSYGDGSSVTAVAATETLTLFSVRNRLVEQLQNFIFGCGINMQNFKRGNISRNRISGIMGMGYGDYSFLNQVKNYVSRRVFSYCLQDFHESMYVRFGDDVIQPPEGISITTMVRFPNRPLYYLNLQGITVAGTPLEIDPNVFFVKADGTGGTIIDIVPPFSSITSEAFDAVSGAVASYIELANSNVRRLRDSELFWGLKLCYQRIGDPDIVYVPDIVFKFGNADFLIGENNGYVRRQASSTSHDFVCLAMVNSAQSYVDSHMTVLGAQQQKNHRIIYDVDSSELLFYPGCGSDNNN